MKREKTINVLEVFNYLECSRQITKSQKCSLIRCLKAAMYSGADSEFWSKAKELLDDSGLALIESALTTKTIKEQ